MLCFYESPGSCLGSHELMEGCVGGLWSKSWKVLGVICARPPGLGRPHTMGSCILPYPSSYTRARCAGSLGTQTAGTRADPVWSGWRLPHETRPLNNPGPVGPFQGGPDPASPGGEGSPASLRLWATCTLSAASDEPRGPGTVLLSAETGGRRHGPLHAGRAGADSCPGTARRERPSDKACGWPVTPGQGGSWANRWLS